MSSAQQNLVELESVCDKLDAHTRCLLDENAQIVSEFPQLQYLVQTLFGPLEQQRKRVVFPGVPEVSRSLSDYEIERKLSERTLLARHRADGGSQCVLLRVCPDEDDDAHSNSAAVLDGIWALHKLRHPAMVSIQAYFYEGRELFVQLPYLNVEFVFIYYIFFSHVCFIFPSVA